MAVAYSSNSALLNSYRNNAVLGLTPGELVLKLYDMGLSALANRDAQRASRVLAQLMECLDFRYHDVAFGLFRLYRFCMDEIKRGEYDVPTRILRDLRDTWAKALGV
ncbi:MAG: flagellar export chaperone FliS [Chloroflexota bacterium]